MKICICHTIGDSKTTERLRKVVKIVDVGVALCWAIRGYVRWSGVLPSGMYFILSLIAWDLSRSWRSRGIEDGGKQ
jgi:hypothetical protein